MGQFISGASTNQNLYKEESKKQQKRPTIKQIEYFPHNDTLHTLYLCPHQHQDSTQLRIRTCVFSNNVGNRFHIFHSCSFDLGRIHLVLNGSLMDDTSVKWAHINFFCVLSNFVETL